MKRATEPKHHVAAVEIPYSHLDPMPMPRPGAVVARRCCCPSGFEYGAVGADGRPVMGHRYYDQALAFARRRGWV